MPEQFWTDSQLASIHTLLHPRSIAVVGATERMHYGGRVMSAALHARDRVRLYPVNPRHQEVFGLKCYPQVTDLPETPDVVCVVVPNEHVMGVLQNAHEKGVRAAAIISAGFAERDSPELLQAQKDLGAFARESGLRFTGPNINGFGNIKDRIWATSAGIARIDPKAGNVGLISQSGATAAALLMQAADAGTGFTYYVATGNEGDLEFCDFGRYMLDDPDTRVIAGFVESLRNIPKFVAFAQLAAERGKPIVVLKLGRSEVGRRAARSHTGSMTGQDDLYEALFAQYGVTRARDYAELLELAQMLAHTPKPPQKGVAVVSHSGGITSLTADMCAAAGHPVPPLSPEGKRVIGHIMGDFGSSNNPADISGHTTGDDYSAILEALLNEPEVGTLAIATTGTDDGADRVIKLRDSTSKAVLFQWTGHHLEPAGLPRLKAAHMPIFYSSDKLAHGLTVLHGYHEWREKRLAEGFGAATAPNAAQQEALAGLPARGALPEFESKRLLAHWRVPGTRELRASSAEEAVSAAEQLGFPVALKADSPEILHKTEAGAVKLNLGSAEQVRAAYAQVGGSVIVQEMVTGAVETIAGVAVDPHMGPMLLFGMGGVAVEVYRDVVRRRCPIARAEALEMIGGVKGAVLLQGFRGAPPADVDALAATLLALSDFAVHAGDRLAELDLNPLMVLPRGQGVKAADALIILQEKPV
ncbi:MAG TPA: acetate--CoA ligase family protein [Chloroflexota bacterium]|nr:acetate--CoA ligase family protein [Chloroflexota bacterium]